MPIKSWQGIKLTDVEKMKEKGWRRKRGRRAQVREGGSERADRAKLVEGMEGQEGVKIRTSDT